MRGLFWVLCLGASACIPSYKATFGPRHDPDHACVPSIIAEPADELIGSYTRIGSVCLASIRFDSAPMEVIGRGSPERDELLRKACRMGGRAVAISGVCSVGYYRAVEFAVLR
jgi:hypothetical protein